MKAYFLLISLLFSIQVFGIDFVKIHAPTAESFSCTEHWDGQFDHVGDALGTDCVVQDVYKSGDRLFMKTFKKNGYENEDWYGFGKNVLAPCDCTVESINTNNVLNEPGIMTPGRAGAISFKKANGIRIVIAHIDNINVSVGSFVKAGKVVATIGNNGYSRNPHLHIAAWNEKQPLQIRFDQKTIDLKSRAESGE
jgi:hypothetical protein